MENKVTEDALLKTRSFIQMYLLKKMVKLPLESLFKRSCRAC